MRKTLIAGVITAGLSLAPAIDAVHAQDETVEEDDDGSNAGLFGLIGLAGLAGLAGLRRRDNGRDRTYGTGVGSSSTPGR